MKSDKLKLILEKIIAEEVSKQLPKAVASVMERLLTENKSTSKVKTEEIITEDEILEEPVKKKIFTGNKKLDEILSNTKPFQRDERDSSRRVMLDSGFEKLTSTDEIITSTQTDDSNLGFIKSMVGESFAADKNPIVESIQDHPDLPEAVEKAITRDYSALMNTINKKKK